MSSLVCISALAFSVVIVIFSTMLAASGQYLLVSVITGVFCLLLVVFAAAIHRDEFGGFDIFSPALIPPLIYISMVIVFIVSTLNNIGYGILTEVSPKDIYYLLSGLLAYICGTLLALVVVSHPLAQKRLDRLCIENNWRLRGLLGWSFVLVVIGSLGVFLYFSQMGFPLFGDVDKIRHGFEGRLYGVGYSFPLLQGLNLILLSLLVYGLTRKDRIYRIGLLTSVVWITFLSAIFGYRWMPLIFLLVPFTMYNYIGKRLKVTPKSILSISMVFILAFSLVGLMGYRRNISKPNGTHRYEQILERTHISANLRYFAPALLALQIRPVSFARLTKMVPEDFDFFYGKYTLATIPVVNRIFPALSKEQVGYYVTNTMFGNDYKAGSGGTALTASGGFYIDFGFGGILIGLLLTGFFIEMCYIRVFKKTDLLSVALYSFILWLSVKWLITDVYLGDLTIIVMALVITRLVRTRPQRHCDFSRNNESPSH